MEISVVDLRIGNLIYYNGKNLAIGKVTAISKELVSNLDMVYINSRIDNYYLVKNINAIPLTEEWLLKFGFTHDTYGNWKIIFNEKESFSNETIYFSVHFKRPKTKDLDCVCVNDTIVSVKNLHQLQNLFFTITGEELTIKN